MNLWDVDSVKISSEIAIKKVLFACSVLKLCSLFADSYVEQGSLEIRFIDARAKVVKKQRRRFRFGFAFYTYKINGNSDL